MLQFLKMLKAEECNENGVVVPDGMKTTFKDVEVPPLRDWNKYEPIEEVSVNGTHIELFSPFVNGVIEFEEVFVPYARDVELNTFVQASRNQGKLFKFSDQRGNTAIAKFSYIIPGRDIGNYVERLKIKLKVKKMI